MRQLIFIFFSFFFSLFSFGQNDSTITEKKKSPIIKTIAIPSVFIASGFALNKSQFEKDFTKDIRNQVGNNYENHIDDYIQYVPIAEMYIADACGIKAKNHWFDQTKNLAISNLVTAIFVHSIKRGMNKTRPSGAPYAFPSGHTATAFTGATVLYHEFKESSPILAYSGYAFAGTTGAFRIINHKHWLSDVLAGAGISMLVTNLVYRIEPIKNFNPFKKNKEISLIPYYNNNGTGIFFTKRF